MFAVCLLVTQLAVQYLAFHRRCVGGGKFITRPMAIAYLIWKARRKVRRGVWSGRLEVTGHEFRMKQLVVVIVLDVCWISMEITTSIPTLIFNLLFFVPPISLYGDDVVSSIDKDQWKKRWSSLKNKVKWKWVPMPVPVRVR